MVLIPCLLAMISVGGAQAHDSLMAKIAPHPTGQNGYEEYLHAGDLAGPDLWGMYDSWMAFKQNPNSDSDATLPPLPPGVTVETPDLGIRKAANERLSGAFEVMKSGNLKPVFDPRQTLSFDTTFPEFSRFKILAKIGINKAYVEFAEGRSSQAVKDLLEGVRISRNIFGTNLLISSLVSIAMQAIFLSEFNRHLNQLSYDDALLIDKTCNEFIVTPLPIREMLKREFEMTANSLDLIIENPDQVLSDDDDKRFSGPIKGLSVLDKQKLKDFLLQGLNERFADQVKEMTGPMSGWPLTERVHDPVPSPEDKSVSSMAILLLDNLHGRHIGPQVASAMAKSAIQLRLLQLHAKVIEYHWLNGKWPKRIEQFAGPKMSIDPFTGHEFHYELNGETYQLYSTGVPEMGPIELKYRNRTPSRNTDPGLP